MDHRVCSRCVIPANFPGIRFDDDNVCSLCRESPPPSDRDQIRAGLKARVEAVIEDSRGKGEYDCIVAFSGGKDSAYTLMTLVTDYRLNCLAVLIDNSFVSEQATKNCNAVTDSLGVDFHVFRPAPTFMKRMYRSSVRQALGHPNAAIKRASDICNSCIGLINNYVTKTALRHQTPLVAGGYIAGQVPKDAALIELNLSLQQQANESKLAKLQAVLGPAAKHFFSIDASLIANSPRTNLSIINPMIFLSKSEDEIVEAISELGWKKPTDTGQNSSNCKLNDLGIRVHYEKHGFHPYLLEIADQVRSGMLHRSAALERTRAIPERHSVSAAAQEISLDLDEV